MAGLLARVSKMDQIDKMCDCRSVCRWSKCQVLTLCLLIQKDFVSCQMLHDIERQGLVELAISNAWLLHPSKAIL